MSKQQAAEKSAESFGQIISATSIMGGSAGFTFLIGILRTKAAALLLGTVGIGLMTALLAVTQFIGTIAGLGIQMSAVREMAIAAGSGDESLLAKTVVSLRRTSWLSGVLGMLATMALSTHLSEFAFGNGDYASQIAWLGVTILFGNLCGAELGLLQGLRRIGDLAKANVIGFALSTLVAVLLFASFGIAGVVPALIAGSLIQFLVARAFSRKVSISTCTMTWRESIFHARGLVRLGLAFMGSSLIISAAALAVNALVTNMLDLTSLGLFAAAFAVSAMFVNFVLRAMGADFYPRLAEQQDNYIEINRLTNEQTETGILLALPGMLLMLGVSYWVLLALYSSEFVAADSLIGWFVLGSMFRLIAWPMGFIIRALGDEVWFLSTIALFQGSYVLFVWLFLPVLGLEGAGVGFLLMNVIAVIVLALVTHRLTGFVWSRVTAVLIAISVVSCVAMFFLAKFLPQSYSLTLSIFVSLVSGFWCLRELVERLGPAHRLSRAAQKVPFLS